MVSNGCGVGLAVLVFWFYYLYWYWNIRALIFLFVIIVLVQVVQPNEMDVPVTPGWQDEMTSNSSASIKKKQRRYFDLEPVPNTPNLKSNVASPGIRAPVCVL